MRVRTTSRGLAPALRSAASTLRSAWTVWAYGSPCRTIFPASSVAVVPETYTKDPTRTAREYPTIGSHSAPDAMFSRRKAALPSASRPLPAWRVRRALGLGRRNQETQEQSGHAGHEHGAQPEMDGPTDTLSRHERDVKGGEVQRGHREGEETKRVRSFYRWSQPPRQHVGNQAGRGSGGDGHEPVVKHAQQRGIEPEHQRQASEGESRAPASDQQQAEA